MVKYEYRLVKVSGPYEDTIKSKEAIEKKLNELGEKEFNLVDRVESEQGTNYLILKKE